MSFHYDPMTGERIEDDDVEKETDQELSKETDKVTDQEQNSEEVHEAETEKPEKQPSQDNAAEDTLQGNAQKSEFNAIPEETNNDKSPSAGPVIAIIIAAVVVIAALGFAVFKFMGTSKYGKNGKFITAFEKSMEWGSLAEAMDLSDIAAKGKLTMTLDAKIDGHAVSTEYAYDRKAGKYSIYAKYKIEDYALDATAFLDRKKVLLKVPALIKEPLMYNYTEEKTGYLTKLAGSKNLEKLDESLVTSTSDIDTEEYQKRMKDIFIKSFNKLDFKATDSETFEINGKDKKCKGYTAQLNEEFYRTFLEEFSDFIEDYSIQMSINNENIDEFKDSIDKLLDDIEDVPETNLTIYLTDGKIARAEIESNDHEAYVEFNGGNYWTENMTIGVDNTDIEISGDVADNKESRVLECGGVELFSYEYDKKDGNLELSALAGTTTGSIEGTLKKKKGGFELAITDVKASGMSLENYLKDFEATLSVESSADVREISDDDAYDLGTMSEEDYQELIMKVTKNIEEVKDSLPDSLQSILGYGLGSSMSGIGGSSYGDYNYDSSDYGYGDSSYDDYGSDFGYGSDYEDEEDEDNYDDEDDDDYNSLFGNY
ncbi:MAG: hypothetical protein K6G84_06690 [Lachnospiraceae bacterium]|nr:hypothetical protein [Lachnospiraceae bacterium]